MVTHDNVPIYDISSLIFPLKQFSMHITTGSCQAIANKGHAFAIRITQNFYTLRLMPVKLCFAVQLYMANDSSLPSAISAVLIRSVPAL